MNIHTIFGLTWKSMVRHPLFEQTILYRLIISVYVLSLICLLYVGGLYVNLLIDFCFPSEITPVNSFILLIVCMLLIDFGLKFFLKRNSVQFISLRRFPNSQRPIRTYTVLKEVFNLWNFYLLFFFFHYLTTVLYNEHGLLITICLFAGLYALQLSVSRLVNYIKHKQDNQMSAYKIYYASGYSQNITVNYLLLNIKMMWRSPRLRQQLFSCLVISVGYIYLISTQKFADYFSINLFLLSFAFSFFTILSNQILFSAEGSFFDHLMIVPGFRKILPAKYLFCLFFSSIIFGTVLFIMPFNWKLFYELFSIFIYSIGMITLLSFSSILFVTTKIDLFGSQYKMMTNPPSVQSLSIFLIYGLSIGLVLIISWLFSTPIAVIFMLITGGLSILLHKQWFNFLYRCFYANKYEKMEIFRIQ